MSDNQNKILTSMNEINAKLTSFTECSAIHQKELIAIRSENKNLKDEIEKLKKANTKLQQTYKSNAIEIKGIKMQKNENLEYILHLILSALKIDNFQTSAIDSIFRIKSNQTIFVKFIRNVDKMEIIKKSKQKHLKGTDLGLEYSSNIFINESLAPITAMLFYEARKLKAKYGIKYIWHKNGDIFLKKNENDSTLRIESIEEIEELRKHLNATRSSEPPLYASMAARRRERYETTCDTPIPIEDSAKQLNVGQPNKNDETNAFPRIENPSSLSKNPKKSTKMDLRTWAQMKSNNVQSKTLEKGSNKTPKRLRTSPE